MGYIIEDDILYEAVPDHFQKSLFDPDDDDRVLVGLKTLYTSEGKYSGKKHRIQWIFREDYISGKIEAFAKYQETINKLLSLSKKEVTRLKNLSKEIHKIASNETTS